MKTALTCLLLVALALPSLSSAQSAVSVASPATMTASEVAARLAFVESRIAAETKTIERVEPFLTLEGLRILFEKNRPERGELDGREDEE